jgi:hypothetical protein
MPNIQAILRQQLIDETARLVARGGPGAMTWAGQVLLPYEPMEDPWYEPPGEGETFYPLAAVLAALPYRSLRTLQQDWNEALGRPGPLPVYLHETAEGHYTALVPESLVFSWLIYLTPMCDAVMLAEEG